MQNNTKVGQTILPWEMSRGDARAIPRNKMKQLNNMQVLCEDCNVGKSNRDETDWR